MPKKVYYRVYGPNGFIGHKYFYTEIHTDTQIVELFIRWNNQRPNMWHYQLDKIERLTYFVAPDKLYPTTFSTDFS